MAKKSEWAQELEALDAGPQVPQGEESEWAKELKVAEATQQRSPAVTPAKGIARLKMIPEAIATGTMGLVGLPGTLQQIAKATGPWGDPNAPDWKTDPKTGRAFVNYLTGGLPSGADFEAAAGKAVKEAGITGPVPLTGLSNHPELAPQNAPERYGQAVAAALPSAALVGPLGLPTALTTTVGGAVAAQAAHDLDPESKWLPIVAGIAGSLGAGWATNGVKNYIKNRALTKSYNSAVQELDDLERESFVLRDPALQTKPVAVQMAENKLTAAKEAQFAVQHPGQVPPPTANQLSLQAAEDAAFAGRQEASRVADQVKAASRKEMDATKQMGEEAVRAVDEQVLGTFTSTASKVGNATTLDEAGKVLQDSARHWVNNVMPKKLADASKDLNLAIPDSTPMQVDNYRATLEKLAPKEGALQGQLEILGSPLPKALKKNLDAAGEAEQAADDLATLAGEAAPPPTLPTWAEARALRSRLGDAMANPSLMKGMDQAEISALYSALSDDLGLAAKNAGADDLWTAFNNESTRLYSIRDGVMSKLISAKNADKEIKLTPAQAAGSLIGAGRKGGTELATLREELPDAANALASYQLRSPQGWGKLSPEARSALLPDEGVRATLDDALGAQAKAAETAKAEFKLATQKYNDTVAAANTGAKEGNFSRLKEVRVQQKAVEAERQAAAQKAAAEDLARAKALKEAQEEVDRAREAAEAARAKAQYELEKRLKGKKEKVAKLEASLPSESPMKTLHEIYKNRGAVVAGMVMGNELLPGMVNSLGISPLQAGTGLALGAAVVPPLWNAAKATVRDPKLLAVPATGIVSGQNSLAITPPK